MDLNSQVGHDVHVAGRNHQRLIIAEKYEGSLYCEICRFTANGPLMFDVHVKSRAHRSLTGESIIHCDICNVTSNSEVAHLIHVKVRCQGVESNISGRVEMRMN